MIKGTFTEEDREKFVQCLNSIWTNTVLKEGISHQDVSKHISLFTYCSTVVKQKIEENILEVKRVIEEQPEAVVEDKKEPQKKTRTTKKKT